MEFIEDVGDGDVITVVVPYAHTPPQVPIIAIHVIGVPLCTVFDTIILHFVPLCTVIHVSVSVVIETVLNVALVIAILNTHIPVVYVVGVAVDTVIHVVPTAGLDLGIPRIGPIGRSHTPILN